MGGKFRRAQPRFFLLNLVLQFLQFILHADNWKIGSETPGKSVSIGFLRAGNLAFGAHGHNLSILPDLILEDIPVQFPLRFLSFISRAIDRLRRLIIGGAARIRLAGFSVRS